MDKTVIVTVETLKQHRLYKKTLRSYKRYKVHDEDSASHVGDVVRIEESRPLSRQKRWRVVEVVERAG
jgi:small subunit ribosomal protein S17